GLGERRHSAARSGDRADRGSDFARKPRARFHGADGPAGGRRRASRHLRPRGQAVAGDEAGRARRAPVGDLGAATGRRGLPMTGSPLELSAEERERTLTQSSAHFRNPSGPDLLKRTERFHEYVQRRARHGLWPFSRALEAATGPRTTISDVSGTAREGINFASQDYLGLSQHPSVVEAGIEAMRRFGPHSAGSAVLLGNTRLSI